MSTVVINCGRIISAVVFMSTVVINCGRITPAGVRMSNVVIKGECMGTKFAVIGLDGVSFNMLNPLIKKGVLPNINRIMENSAYGNLRSTVPPMSPTAWTSFMTGKNPGKHGIFNFHVKPAGTYYVKPVISSDIKGNTIWDILSAKGKKVAVINLPMTYPPYSVNGIMISGLGTPDENSEFIYPASIRKEFYEKIDDYMIDVMWTKYSDDKLEEFFKELHHMTRSCYEAANHFLQRDEWDCFMLVFTGTDRLMHRLINYMDEEKGGVINNSRHANPGGDNPATVDNKGVNNHYISAAIDEYFSYLDHLIGNLIYEMGSSNIIFMSDHGFGKFHSWINVNEWLYGQGYLNYAKNGNIKQKALNGIKSVLKSAGIDREKFLSITNSVGGGDMSGLLSQASAAINKIDWLNTKAFCHSCNSIHINLEGREEKGIVKESEYEPLLAEITGRLYQLTDADGNHIVHEVLRRDDVFKGACSNMAPDLLITKYDERFWFDWKWDIPDRSVFRSDPIQKGQHISNGMFIAHGDAFKKARADANITDILPTILHVLKVPIPNDVDGAVLSGIMKNKYANSEQLREDETLDSKHEYSLTEAELNSIHERLKGLGYM